MIPKLITLFAMAALAAAAVVYDRAGLSAPEMAPGALAAPPPEGTGFGPIPAPVVDLTTLGGRHIGSWVDMPEPVVVINFWATWCPPCLAEMPDLTGLAEKSNGQVAVVLVGTDDAKAPLERYRARWQADRSGDRAPHLYWVWDGTKTLSLGLFQVGKVPETIILDRERRMARKVVGPLQAADYAFISSLLAQPAAPLKP